MIVAGTIGILIVAVTIYKAWSMEAGLFFWLLLLAKISFAIGAGLMYNFYYEGGDTMVFYHKALHFNNYLESGFAEYLEKLFDPINYGTTQEPGTEFFIRIVSVISLFSFENYWITSCYMAIISFLCSWMLLRLLSKNDVLSKSAIMIALLVPSFSFWTSGLFKETVVFVAFSIILLPLILFLSERRVSIMRVAVGIVGFLMLFQLKYYYAAMAMIVLIPLVTTLFIKRKYLGIGIPAMLGIFILTLAVPLIAVNYMHYNFHYSRILEVVTNNYHAFGQLSEKQHLLHFHDLKPTLGSFIINFPTASFSGFFRPLPWEAWNLPSILFSIENSVLLALTVFSLRNWRNYLSGNMIILISALLFIGVTSGMLALSAPNFGSLSRYTSLLKPILVLVLMYYGNLQNDLNKMLSRK